MGQNSSITVAQVPQIREKLLNCDWKQAAQRATSGPLHPTKLAGANRERVEAMLAALDFLAERQDLTAPNRDNLDDSKEPEKHPDVKVSVYMKQRNGTMVASQSLELSVDTSKAPVPVTIKVAATASRMDTMPCPTPVASSQPFWDNIAAIQNLEPCEY
jgi:hypothetical protein